MEERPADDLRFEVPLYTVREAAVYLGIPPRTFAHWVKGDSAARARRPLITVVRGEGPRKPSVPFVGLAEGAVVAAFRRVEKLPMKYIRRVLEVLDAELGVEDALASRRLYLHGGQLLWDNAAEVGGKKMLAEILTKNFAFNEVVEGGLKLITYAPDDYAAKIRLPATPDPALEAIPDPVVEADPYRASGKPVTIQGGIRVLDVVDRFRGRESPAYIARDFGITEEVVLEIIRAFYSRYEEAA